MKLVTNSFYGFLPHAVRKSFETAWSLERKRLNRKGISVLSWRNRMLGWHFVSLLLAVGFYLGYGAPGLVFFLGQGLIALTAHHVINYIQHYGLRRRRQNNGTFDRFGYAHAWNGNFFFSGMLSFQLPRHVDHHLNSKRRYQNLQHLEESPQMPMGYFGMFLMALIPSLWFKVMNPRIAAYQIIKRNSSSETAKYSKPFRF